MDFIRRKIKWESCGQFGSPVEILSTEFHGNIGERRTVLVPRHSRWENVLERKLQEIAEPNSKKAPFNRLSKQNPNELKRPKQK